MPPVAPGDGEGLEQARHAVVGDASAIAAGLVAKCAGDPALPQPSWTGNEQVLMASDPCAIDQMCHDGTINAARSAHVEILDAGRLSQGGELESGDQTLGVPFGGLAIDQQAEAIFKAEAVVCGMGLALLVQCLDHAGEAEGDEPFGGGMDQQGGSPFNGSSPVRGCSNAEAEVVRDFLRGRHCRARSPGSI